MQCPAQPHSNLLKHTHNPMCPDDDNNNNLMSPHSDNDNTHICEPKTTTPISTLGKMVVMDVKSEDDLRLGLCNSLCRLVFVGHKAAQCFDRNVDCGS